MHVKGMPHACRSCRLDANDLAAWLQRLDGKGHAADEASASHRNNADIHFRKRIENLKGNCSLSCDHIIVIKGVNHRPSGLFRNLDGTLIGIIIYARHKDDLRTIGPCRFDL